MATEEPEQLRGKLAWPLRDLSPAARREVRNEDASAPQRDTNSSEPPRSDADLGGSDGSVLFAIASRLERLSTALDALTRQVTAAAEGQERTLQRAEARLADQSEALAKTVALRTAMDERARETARMIDDLRTLVKDRWDRSTESVETLGSELRQIAASTTDAMSRQAVEIDVVNSRVADTAKLHADAHNELSARLEEMTKKQASAVAELRTVVETGERDAETRDAELAEDLAALAEEVRALRRRLPVRAKSNNGAEEVPASPTERGGATARPRKLGRRSRSDEL